MHPSQTPLQQNPNAHPGEQRDAYVTRENAPATIKAYSCYASAMQLLSRDNAILSFVARFGQATTAQLREVFFYDKAAKSSCTDVLRRLRTQGMLSNVYVRLSRESKGGSPMGCYQIGPEAWKLYYPGSSYKAVRNQAKLAHTLAVTDMYVQALRAEREGLLTISSYAVEEDAWISVGGANLHPDLHLELYLPLTNEDYPVWVEVDRDSEGTADILRKLRRYLLALEHSAEYPYERFPSVLFLVEHSYRYEAIARLLRRVPEAPEGFFSVELMENFPKALL